MLNIVFPNVAYSKLDLKKKPPRLFVWEILHSTIRKMNKHVQKIQQELEEAKDKLEKQQHKRVTSPATVIFKMIPGRWVCDGRGSMSVFC